MSPTIFRDGPYRFFFFSREESRIHVHVSSDEGEAKFWLDPIVALASSHGLTKKKLTLLQKKVEEHHVEIRSAWKKHFES